MIQSGLPVHRPSPESLFGDHLRRRRWKGAAVGNPEIPVNIALPIKFNFCVGDHFVLRIACYSWRRRYIHVCLKELCREIEIKERLIVIPVVDVAMEELRACSPTSWRLRVCFVSISFHAEGRTLCDFFFVWLVVTPSKKGGKVERCEMTGSQVISIQIKTQKVEPSCELDKDTGFADSR